MEYNNACAAIKSGIKKLPQTKTPTQAVKNSRIPVFPNKDEQWRRVKSMEDKYSKTRPKLKKYIYIYNSPQISQNTEHIYFITSRTLQQRNKCTLHILVPHQSETRNHKFYSFSYTKIPDKQYTKINITTSHHKRKQSRKKLLKEKWTV